MPGIMSEGSAASAGPRYGSTCGCALQQDLDGTEVCSSLEQMSGEAMA